MMEVSASEPPAPQGVVRRPRQMRLALPEVVNPLAARLGAGFFRALPRSPGVYFFYDGGGRLLYIGQSADLRARLGSYRHVTPEQNARRTLRLVHRVTRIEWQLCATPEAAVALEAELLLKHRPPFNRAGVWRGPPWWLRTRVCGQGVELCLRRGSVVAVPGKPDSPDEAPAPPVEDKPPPLLAALSSSHPAPDERWAGPLPPGYRVLHAGLLRRLHVWLHPGMEVADFPAGFFDLLAPLQCRLSPPAPTVAPDLLGGWIHDFALGCGEELLARLMDVEVPGGPDQQLIWQDELTRLSQHAMSALETSEDDTKS